MITKLPAAVFPLLLSVVFVAAAAAHRLLLSGASYRNHWLIKVEVLLLILIVLCLLIEVLGVAVLFFTGKWGAALVTAGLMVLTFVLLLVGLGVDSPTLLYAT